MDVRISLIAIPVTDIGTGISVPIDIFQHITGIHGIIWTAVDFCWVSGLAVITAVDIGMITMAMVVPVFGRDTIMYMIDIADIEPQYVAVR